MYLELEAQLKAFGGSFLWIFYFLLKISPPSFIPFSTSLLRNLEPTTSIESS